MNILNNLPSLFIASFLLLSSLVNLYLISNKNHKLKNTILITIGVVVGFIIDKMLPMGIIEGAFLIGLFSISFSFYKASSLKATDESNLNDLENNIFQVLYWIISGIFIFVGFTILNSYVSNQQTRLLSIIVLPILLFISGFIAYKIADLPFSFKVFLIGLIALSETNIFKIFVNFTYSIIHEIIHLNDSTVFLFPDHPFFDVNYYLINYKIFFNPQITSFFIFTFFTFLSLLLLVRFYWAKIQIAGETSNINVRLKRANLKKIWQKKVFIISLVLLIMFNSSLVKFEAEQGIASDFFPVQSKLGYITISTSKPIHQISEGGMKKYRFNRSGKSINFIVIRWQGKLKTVMDFCEFCKGETEGYRLKDNQLICIICGTPISLDTVGFPGGCNPVPLKAEISKFTIRIKESDLIETYTLKRGNK